MTPDARFSPAGGGARFRDRREAGRKLAQALGAYADAEDVLVLGLPRGGVPVAYEVAEALDAPLDILTVRKLGHPRQPELAMGAIATGGVRVLNREVVDAGDVTEAEIEAVAEEERAELERRESRYRGDRGPPPVEGRTVILVDDGVATGATMRAAVDALREMGAARIVVAVPVAPPDTCRDLGERADECVCVATPEPFRAISLWYERFDQTSDQEVKELLEDVPRAG